MFSQTIKSGFRQIWRRPLLPILNILGLAAGVAVSIVIFLYAEVELNYNSWVTDQENLYRVEGQFLRSSGSYANSTMAPLGPAINAQVEEAVSVVRLARYTEAVKRDQLLNYETIAYTDPGFFEMFPLEFISGGPAGFFGNNNGLMISEAMAIKYFGSLDIIGETIILDGEYSHSVTGIFKDVDSDTDFRINFVAKIQDSRINNPDSWSNVGLHTYVRLKDGARIADAEEKLALMVDEHRPFTGSSPGNMREIFKLFLQPFGDIHLGSSGRTSDGSIGNYATVYGFVAIAFLILTISIFNYVSLATARAVEREKEFCLRKVSGATAWQIIRHVMTEMIAQTIPAVAVGVLIATDLLPFFSDFIGVDYSLAALFTPTGVAVVMVGTIAVSILAGLYPALIISRFRPVLFLSGGRSQRPGVARIRTILVFVQFTVAISLIIGAVAISRQMAHIGKADLGFDSNNLLIVRGVDAGSQPGRSQTYMDRVNMIPGVTASARSSVVPFDNSFFYEAFMSEHVSYENSASARIIFSDFDLVNTLGADLTGGRFLADIYADDKINMFSYEAMRAPRGNRNVVINEQFMRKLGYATPEAIMGKQIQMILEPEGQSSLTVVGVVGDIAYQSARSEMESRIYTYYEPALRNLMVRTSAGAIDDVIPELESVWRSMYPDTPFRVEYMSERLDALYADERQQLKLFVTFSVLAVILSLIGLMGLVLNSIMHKTREISMRRVLGATLGDNIKLFTWQYLKPVLIANVPAWAAAYYFLSNWLSKYPSRIDVGAGLYLLGSGLTIVVTLVLVTLIVAKVADTPPALALKHE